MSASSDELLTALGKVNSHRISCFLQTAADSELRTIGFIERRYSEQEINFGETLLIVCALGWLETPSTEIALTTAGAKACAVAGEESKIRAAVLSEMMRPESPFARPLAQYICQFHVEGRDLIFKPSLTVRNEQRPLRDLLIDLRVVSYRQSDDSFALEDTGFDLYFWALNVTSPSQKQFEAAQRRRREIGYEAELVAFAFEKARLGFALADRVVHVSSEAPFARFDIKSVTVENGEVFDRYIEVKAVPKDDLRFYWSSNEVATSRLLGDRYFLYLVPYALGRGFDAASVVMLRNPSESVLEDRGWIVEEDALVCSRGPSVPPTRLSRD